MSSVAEDVLTQYFTDVRRHRLLTKDDEVRLGQAVAAGQRAEAELAEADTTPGTPLPRARRAELGRVARAGHTAQEEFIQANLRLVIAIAKRYRSSGLPLEDLVQEGNLGLLKAVERFDWRRGFRFSTYASWWIRQAIAQGVRQSAHAIYRPAHVCDRVRLVQDAQQRLEAVLGRRPRVGELASETALPEHQVLEVLRLVVEPRSLSEPASRDGNETPLAEVIADPSTDSPFERLATALLPAELARFLSPLDEREQRVLCLRYGLQGYEPLTLAEVSHTLGLTSQRISQITEGAIAKLRHPSWRAAWEAATSLVMSA
ncbi:MAG TPA: sigma-70 family RNA polymerase sigma factor [Acidimicrobiales bacterium]|jgi:RNA polymerase sigma factor (sigma-70 family)|nr:sigma-70 family RNA polymerase sigma factor [Acidimicrobiales bacterium]